MSADEMPVEILVIIFKKLKGKEAAACRAVCCRWRDIVDSLSDEVWERYCCLEFRDPRAANRVSTLGYRELYKSLSLWSKVEQAEVTCRQVSEKSVFCFKILDNNTLAILVNDKGVSYCGNEIQYYNLKDMELISTECYDFELYEYDENERLIVLVGISRCLWIITKSNKKKKILDYLDDDGMPNYKLFDTDVYYINRQGDLCAAQLKVLDREETVETVKLADMPYSVIAFAYAGKNSVYMLTEEWDLFCYEGANLKMRKFMDADQSTLVRYLMDLSFDWTDPSVYRMLTTDTDIETVGLSALSSVRAVHSHSNIVLIGTPQNTIQIFIKPYKKNRTLKLYRVRPNRSIEMGILSSFNWPASGVLGVVEVLNGHRMIVVNNNHQLFFVDLLHKTATKQSVHHAGLSTSTTKKPGKSIEDKGTPLKTKGNKNATKKSEKENKIKNQTNVFTKHGYNTRSKNKCLGT